MLNPTPQPPPTSGSGTRALRILLFVCIALWWIAVSALFANGLWGAADLAMATGQRFAPSVSAIAGLGFALALVVPTLPLALLLKSQRDRQAYRAWAGIAVFALPAALLRLWPKTATQPAALSLIALCILVIAVLLLTRRAMAGQPRGGGVLLALAVGLLSGLAWLAAGALGSWFDTALATASGLCVAVAAALWFARCGVASLPAQPDLADLLFDGTVVGVGVMALGAALGFDGAQVLLVFPLGLLGLAGAIFLRGSGAGALAALLTPALAMPLALVDPDELTVVLGEVLAAAFPAVTLTVLIAAVLSAVTLIAYLLARRSRKAVGPALGSLAVAGAALLGLAVYAGLGHPGWNGDRLFVILKDQADVSRAEAIPDRAQRMKTVYDTLVAHADRTQAPLRKTLSDLGIPYKPYYLVNAIEVHGGLPTRLMLEARPDVARVLESPHLRPVPVPAAEPSHESPPFIAQWNLTSIGAERVWSEFRVNGTGIVIGQSDSGVDGTHVVLRNAYRGRGGHDDYNWFDPWFGTQTPTDIGGHGTHTLGSILGRADGRNAPTGVAPGAEWFGCVNLARNLASPALYLDCMQFMLAPWPRNGDALKDGNPALGAHVINNSWGCPPVEGCDPEALRPAVAALRSAGIFVVASAGNDGPACSTVQDPIALYDESFTVGAVDSAGKVTSFSSRGPVTVDGSGRTKPDILAPGANVLSAWPGGGYISESGTSMAGPHIVGVVALMWSAQPKLVGNIDATERILRETATPLSGNLPVACGGLGANVTGAGIVNAYAAVRAALSFK